MLRLLNNLGVLPPALWVTIVALLLLDGCLHSHSKTRVEQKRIIVLVPTTGQNCPTSLICHCYGISLINNISVAL